ncbi:MAG: hypothetical protein ACLPOQ_07890 [Desulfobaccales bacterium]
MVFEGEAENIIVRLNIFRGGAGDGGRQDSSGVFQNNFEEGSSIPQLKFR